MPESTGQSRPAHNRFDPRYLSFFEEFNRQRYFEAHEVLEGLWLESRDAHRDFYKGLIQVAAVFLKLKQGKPEPARRLATRSLGHLQPYRPRHESLNVDRVAGWLESVIAGRAVEPVEQLQLDPDKS